MSKFQRSAETPHRAEPFAGTPARCALPLHAASPRNLPREAILGGHKFLSVIDQNQGIKRLSSGVKREPRECFNSVTSQEHGQGGGSLGALGEL